MIYFFLLWPKCSNLCIGNGINVEDFFNMLYDFYLMHLIFVSVWFCSWTKHISCLCLPWLCTERPLRMGTASWGAESSDHGTSCNNLKEGAERTCAQGWGSGVHREEMCPRTARRNPVTSLRTVLVRDLNIWLWAQHPCLSLTQLSSGTPRELSPCVPWKLFSLHLHTTQPQEGFTLDSEVKAVGHL